MGNSTQDREEENRIKEIVKSLSWVSSPINHGRISWDRRDSKDLQLIIKSLGIIKAYHLIILFKKHTTYLPFQYRSLNYNYFCILQMVGNSSTSWTKMFLSKTQNMFFSISTGIGLIMSSILTHWVEGFMPPSHKWRQNGKCKKYSIFFYLRASSLNPN